MVGRITIFGSFMMDLVAYTSKRPKTGETLRGDSFAISLGGKGFNQAIAVARAGAKSAMLGNLGVDGFGDDFMQALTAEGVDSTSVERSKHQGTGVGLPVVIGDGDNSIIIIPQANDLGSDEYIARHSNIILESDILLLQLEVPLSGNLAAAKLAKDNGVKVILTPAPVSSLTEWFGLVDVLVPNEGEAEALTGVAQSLEDQVKALRNLVGCENIVITLGANGAFVSDGKRSEIIKAPQVKAIDTVGAGDTLCANLAARLASGDDLFSSTRFGIYAASLKVTGKGSSMAAPSPEEVAKFIKEKSS